MTDRRVVRTAARPLRAVAVLLFAAALFAGALSGPVLSQDQPQATAPGEAASPADAAESPAAEEGNSSDLPLATAQEQVRRRFKRFEETLLKLSTSLRKTEPDRALMLDRARGRINQERFDSEMIELSKLLASRPLGDSVLERQEELITRMQALLELLQSEDRQKEIAKEKERIAGLIKDVNKLIGEQKGARQMTEGASQKAREAQEKVAKNAGDVLRKIDEQDAAKRDENEAEGAPKEGDRPQPESPDGKQPENGETPPGEQLPGEKPDSGKSPTDKPSPGGKPESKPEDAKPSDAESSESSPSDSKPMPSDSSESSPSKPSKSKPKPSQGGQPQPGGKPSENEESPESPSEEQESDTTPGRQELEKAREEMKRAIEDLEKDARGKAGEKQDEAIRQLIAAKEKLEEILR